MRSDTGQPVYLKDYRAPDYLVDHVEIHIDLDAQKTRVICRLNVRPNPKGVSGAPLRFDGDGLSVVKVLLNDQVLPADAGVVNPDQLILHAPPNDPFTLLTETHVDAAANLAFSGLYLSNGIFCTQCEAEGFRRITFFPDRPDILSTYRTRISARVSEAPLLLGNGNPVESGIDDKGRHYAIWHDPFPKPCYLFAVVGGDLDVLHDRFITKSGHDVALGIFVEKGKAERAAYAMDALKRAMKWDEDVFNCEYDLDVFNIVAVSDFNMGAMENKGLNIFNDKYILATPDTATDADFEHIEAIVAHEYFHNWTGNRITCRDWFQLCLKEGLTVYRDQEFTADQRSRVVKRIMDARDLRAAQFPEDAGPLAHNVRPESYREINNFYTATVYEKGAELIRVLKLVIGETAFKDGMVQYFNAFDGTAATMEDFISCFTQSSGRDLTQFMRWYSQAGTPVVHAETEFDSEAETLTLHLSQTTPATPGQPAKLPFLIPISLGLVASDGTDLPLLVDNAKSALSASARECQTGVFELSNERRTIKFSGLRQMPALSILRDFSAPVILDYHATESDQLTLIANDTNMFNRWQCTQTFAMSLMLKILNQPGRPEVSESMRHFCQALEPLLMCPVNDPALLAQMLTFPGEQDIAREKGRDVNPAEIFRVRDGLLREIGCYHEAALREIYTRLMGDPQTANQERGASARALCNAILTLLTATNKIDAERLALKQYNLASNMTARIGALANLCRSSAEGREYALGDFYQRYSHDALIIDKWFALQATIPGEETLERVLALMQHPAYSATNPNRIRALAGSFCMGNPTGFNAVDGRGYRFLTGLVGDLDSRNPQVAARMLGALGNWRRLEIVRRTQAKAALESLNALAHLSPDVRDIVTRALA